MILTIVAAALCRRLVIIDVRGESMRPALAPGDRVLMRRIRLGAVRRGDVVVIAAPEPHEGLEKADRWRIKRVAALPGDPVPPGIPVTERVVPAGRLVVLGDNARHSVDSRTTGFYRADDLIGVIVPWAAGRSGNRHRPPGRA